MAGEVESKGIEQILAELAELHAAATPGEWEAHPHLVHINGLPPVWEIIQREEDFWLAYIQQPPHHPTPNGKANSAWIIAAHNHYPALREEIKRLRAELATAERRGAVEELRRLADIAEGKIGGQYVGMRRIDARYLRDRADELEGKNAANS